MSNEIPRKYIAWDTSALTGVISAFEIKNGAYSPAVNWSLSLETSKHSERLLWTIDTVLQSAGWKPEELSGISVGIGPGSFTGLRIGITTARIFARALNIQVTPLSSLSLLANGVRGSLSTVKKSASPLVIACTDATKGEWFTRINSKERVYTPDDLKAEITKLLKKAPSRKWIAVGQSVQRYPEFWNSLPQKNRMSALPEEHHIQSQVLGKAAFEAIQLGLSQDSIHIVPRYLRASEAEVKLKKGILKINPILHRGGIA